MYTLYVCPFNSNSWSYEGSFSTASEVANIARAFVELQYSVEIDSKEVKVENDSHD